MAESGATPVYRGNLDRLVNKVLEERGLDLSQYRRPYLERRLAARLRALDIHTYRQYTDRLDHDSAEYDHLIETLTINVTEFFRDRAVWEILRRQVVPDLLAHKQRSRSRTIRIWSAGCATGEEPYSAAMVLLDAMGKDAGKFLLSVVGTDLDPDALAIARRGVYHKDKLKRIVPSYQVRFLSIGRDSTFEIAPDVRRLCRFTHYSLFDEAPMRMVDLIMCRNVFIYFDRQRQAKVIESFCGAMADDAYLVLGRSEKLTSDAARLFVPVDGRERVYHKPGRS